MLKLKDNILNFLITPKGKIIARFITFLVAVFSFWSTISFFNTFKPYLYKNMKNSNLEILIEAIQSHWKIGYGTSITVAFFIISTITLIASFTNIIFKPIYVKLILVCYLGIIPIIFIFSLVLAATEPSDTTLIFSILSAIGASIAFCITVFKNHKF